ncbi:MAG TPA: hypothetical protein VFM69_01210, partial [Pricia sp.]|nr:hypothetical protein [Pricia sp.]
AAEVAFTPTSPISATNVQAAIEELGSEKAEDDEVVKLTGDQTIAGLKTFNQDIILSNSGSFQFQSIDNLSRYDFASFADGFRIVPQTRPTTGDLYVDGDYFQFDEANLRWEIDDSPIITQANAASLGVGGGGSDTSLSDTDQTIPDATTRIINTENLGELSFRQFGTELMRLGGNNDNALLVGALEGLTGNVVFRSPIEPLNLPIASNDASLFSGGIIKDSGKLYFSDGTDWVDLGADPLAPTVIADGYTITAADGNANKVFEYNGVTDIDVSFPDVFDVGDKVSFRQLNSGKIRIEYTGTGTGDGIDFQTYDANGSAQVYKGNYAYVNEGNWELYVPSSNAYVGANAANPDNEVNGFAGTRNTTGAAGVIISSTTTTPAPTNGTYALKLERKNGGGDADMYIELTGLVTGTEYTVTFDAIELVTQNEFFIQTPASDWTEGLTQTFVNSLTWTEMGFTMTPLVDDPEIRVVGLGVLLGDSVAIDNIMAIPTGN